MFYYNKIDFNFYYNGLFVYIFTSFFQMEKKKVLVAISGGVDSAYCMYDLIKKGYYIEAVHFQHGIFDTTDTVEKVKEITTILNVPPTILNLKDIFIKLHR